jgi:integrase
MKKSGNKRDAFTLSEWKEIYTYLKSWHKNATKNKDNQDDQTERELVRCFILILANTGLRFGELRVLRWRNVSISKTGTKTFAKINVKIGKTGQRDSVIGRRGDLFKKVKSLTKWKDNDDYVFTDIQTGEQLSERTLRRLWEELVDNTSLKDKIPRPVYYCLRHTYATFRLYADVPIFDLASNMGCGVKYIEDHYGHVKREQKAKILTKDFKSESSQFIMEF